MKTDPSTKNSTPRTLADYIGVLDAKIYWLASVAEKIDGEVVGVDEAQQGLEPPPKWPGAFIAAAPPGLKLGVYRTTLNKEWHEIWLFKVNKRVDGSVLLPILLALYNKALGEVEALLSQDLVRLEDSFPAPPAPFQAAPPY